MGGVKMGGVRMESEVLASVRKRVYSTGQVSLTATGM